MPIYFFVGIISLNKHLLIRFNKKIQYENDNQKKKNERKRRIKCIKDSYKKKKKSYDLNERRDKAFNHVHRYCLSLIFNKLVLDC